VPRIPYPDPTTLTDPDIRAALELAARRGTPRPESQAIRAHNPAVLRAFTYAWETTFHAGVLDHRLKELCRLYVSASIDCEY
jgi:alkylhydroperoxidase/carboxymuconolactone decarboxylase family protein YurZ